MKKFFIIMSIALLLIGQSLSLQKSDLMIGGDDDLIEIHSERPEERVL